MQHLRCKKAWAMTSCENIISPCNDHFPSAAAGVAAVKMLGSIASTTTTNNVLELQIYDLLLIDVTS